MSTDQIKALRKRLAGFYGKFPKVAEAAGLSYSWVSKFANGKIENPTVKKLALLDKGLDRMDVAA